ncbi:resolvase [Clostridia bacterium]|nr:resolvase [Clostridia bacterium]
MARKSRKNSDTAVATTPAVKVYSAGAYIRLSAVDRKQKGDSIEVQQTIIADFIAEHGDIELTDTYIDNGLSGQTLERPAFQRMLADMESGKIDCALCKDLSRLGRSAIDTGYYIEKYFPTLGVRFIAINDDYDSADGNSGGIMISLKNMVNEAYALDIGRKIRTTKQMQIRDGGFVGQFAPYGYIKNPNNCHALLVEPTAAVIVKQMFDMAANGDGYGVILEWLNGSGVLPPQQHLHSIGVLSEKQVTEQTLWNKTAIRTILTNCVYVGDMAQGKKRTQSRVTKPIPTENWVITPNTHEAIVTREIFEKVQSMRVKTGNNYAKTLEQRRTENPFIRKVFCGHCGHTMFFTGKKGTSWRSLDCATVQKYGNGSCVHNRIRESELREKLLTVIQKQAAVFADSEKLTALTLNADNGDEIRNAQAELDRNGSFLKGLYESLVASDITEQEYRELKRSYEAKIAELTARVKGLKTAEHDKRVRQAEIRKTRKNFDALTALPELTPDIVDALIERITVFNDSRIEIAFKFSDKSIETEGLKDE